jgi:signal transduction histidine kinase
MKLLHKSLRLYLVFSVFIFIFSIPVFYFLIQNLWIKDVDESLIYQKEKITEGLRTEPFEINRISDFTKNAEKFDLGVYIYPLDNVHFQTDSLYNNDYFDTTRQHFEPFRELVSYVTVDSKTYKIIVRKDLVETADLIREIFITQAILFLILLAGILIFNSYFARKIWQPFYSIVSKLKSFRIDQQEPIVAQKTKIVEFNELGEAIHRLTENNIRTFQSQIEFTENAAHETQTPLAVIKNQIDLLAQDMDLTFHQSEIITRVDNNIRILTKLNRNLLFLAKIENEQFDKNDSIDISVLTSEICSAFKEQMKLKGISYLSVIQPEVRISSNTYLLHSLLTNLLTNAIKYNIHQGSIKVELNKKCMIFSNTGPSQQLDESKIYERFYKNESSSNSSGLGLAIAKKICESLNYTILYNFAEPNLHSFTVEF